ATLERERWSVTEDIAWTFRRGVERGLQPGWEMAREFGCRQDHQHLACIGRDTRSHVDRTRSQCLERRIQSRQQMAGQRKLRQDGKNMAARYGRVGEDVDGPFRGDRGA